MIDRLKYKKLYNEMTYLQSEVELIEAEIKEIEANFSAYFQDFCIENNIEIEKHKRNERLFTKPRSSDYTAEDKKTFSKLYKQVAKKIHPDKFANHDNEEYFQERFKELSTAFDEENWATILKMAKEENIETDINEAANIKMQKIITDLRESIRHKKSQYNWLFKNCGEDEECKKNLAKDLAKRLYNINI